MMDLIRSLFRSPSAFANDPRGFAVNQILHALLIGAGPAALAHMAHDMTGFPALPIVAVQLILYAAWEVAQHILHDAEPWDCVEDFGFVACGALAVLFLSPPVAVVGALFLVSGYLRRAA